MEVTQWLIILRMPPVANKHIFVQIALIHYYSIANVKVFENRLNHLVSL